MFVCHFCPPGFGLRIRIQTRIQGPHCIRIACVMQVHKFMIAPRDFSLATGELTPTMKLKRHTVLELYAKKIDQVWPEERI